MDMVSIIDVGLDDGKNHNRRAGMEITVFWAMIGEKIRRRINWCQLINR